LVRRLYIVPVILTVSVGASATAAAAASTRATPLNACKFVTMQDATTILGADAHRIDGTAHTCLYASPSRSTTEDDAILMVKAWKNGSASPPSGRGIRSTRVPIRGARCWRTVFWDVTAATPHVTTCVKGSRRLEISALRGSDPDAAVTRALHVAVPRL